jgi:hypothetical protein
MEQPPRYSKEYCCRYCYFRIHLCEPVISLREVVGKSEMYHVPRVLNLY